MEEPLVMTTIVSSRMLRRMATDLGAHYDETLTGFKWIAHRAREHRSSRGWNLVLGYEEALGYTIGDTVADKDGISAAVIFAELAAVTKARGETMRGRLDNLYRRFGLHRSRQHSLVCPGADGIERRRTIMSELRERAPREIADRAVEQVRDWSAGLDGLPPSDVLGFELEGAGRILVRPSGTEPKIKFYVELVIEPAAIGPSLAAAAARADTELSSLVADLLELTGER
jgi:phosphomannomutase